MFFVCICRAWDPAQEYIKQLCLLTLFIKPLIYVLYSVKIYGEYIRQTIVPKAYVKIIMNINQNMEHTLQESRDFFVFKNAI